MIRTICIPLVALLALAAPALAAPEPLPTLADIQKVFDAGDYPGTLQRLTRVMALKGKAAEPYDRHALLRLKGETHLRMKVSTQAVQAFAEAIKFAPDGPATANDIATELVVRRSGGTLAYQPRVKDPNDKSKSPGPIDVVDPESRKKAIDALFADEWAATEPKVAPLKVARTLSPLLDTLPAIRNLRWLEMASTGMDERSKALVADLPAKTIKLIDESVKDMTDRVVPIEFEAMQVQTSRVAVNDKQTGKILGFKLMYKRKGPTSQRFAILRDIMATCAKVHGACDEMGGSLGATGKEFDASKVKIEELGAKVKVLLDHDWSQKYDDPPAAPTELPKTGRAP